MRRLGIVVAGLCMALAAAVSSPAGATPFADVPASHWAYQDIQSLAADGLVDGYPDGEFKGDRPLSRYEMAVVVARVIAKLQENGGKGASRADLDKLQKLIDALKDELDALGVRTTSVEDAVTALDRRTAFAQSLSLHGVFLPNVTFRQRLVAPATVANTTGTPVTTYYGTIVPGPANAYSPAVATVDPFITAFLTTDDSNDPLTQTPSGIQIRQDSRFSLAYAVNENLTVSLPVHLLNFEYGGEFTQQSKIDLEPGVDVAVAHAGALSNLDLSFGIIDDLGSSRTGLAFRAPSGYGGVEAYTEPLQPFQKGVEVKGTVAEGAFGLTDFAASFTRLDDTLLNTQPDVVSPNVLPFEANQYFLPVVPPQETFTQTNSAMHTDTFAAGSGSLAQVYLTQKAQDGSIYVSAFDGSTAAAPAFTYNDAYNLVVFATPLPPGSTISLTYRGLAVNFNAAPQQYMVHARANQTFKGLPGVGVGLTFNRIFGFDDAVISGSGPDTLNEAYASAVNASGDVSDTVFGVDFEAPLALGGAQSAPVLFGEAATSTFTPDYRTIAAVDDSAALVGLRLNLHGIGLSAQYQSVGTNFLDGAPLGYYGNAPPLFAAYRAPYLPGFFGFANNVAINTQFDSQFTRIGRVSPDVQGNPNLTFLVPMWDPFVASGPEFFSAFAPNTRGPTATIGVPARLGAANLTVTGSYAHLDEIAPGAGGTLYFGPQYRPTQAERSDTYELGTSVRVPAFGRQITANLSGSYGTLRRPDFSVQQYYPVDPATQQFDPSAVAAADAAFPAGGNFGRGGSQVGYYPNYVNVHRIAIGAAAAVPLTHDLTLGGSYSTQRYGGSYGTTLGQNISERKDYYTGSLTYAIPKTNSSVTFITRRYTYLDDVVPSADLSQNRQDVNFTVRF